MINDNPLLDFSGFPRFEEIKPKHIEPAVDSVLAHNRQSIDALVSHVKDPQWNNLMEPLEVLGDQLERVWAPVSHLNAVRDSQLLREAYENCLPKLSDYAAGLGQNRALYEAIKKIHDREDYSQLTPAQRKVIENELRDFRLSGVDLDSEDQLRYRRITSELSRLANEFSRNVLDATEGWHLHVIDPDDLAGIPENACSGAAEAARQKDLTGWVFSLQGPSYIPFMTYADNRELRRKMYCAYVTRASKTGPDGGKWDNGGLMMEILRLRRELGLLLGFNDYASYSLETKMARDSGEVADFLMELAEKSIPTATREFEELKQFALDYDGTEVLEAWDMAWYSEKLRQQRYDFSQEDLRPYFPLSRVLSGMFETVQRLFDIEIEATPALQCWHHDVQFFKISDQSGNIRGHFYIDLYARQQKRGGAWMADCIGRRRTVEGVQLPAAFLTCNFSPPAGDRPSLLTHEEVMTLFHEFGHGLHHLLTRVDVAGVAGINGVPWDAVELPSQFLENWCWEREALDLISGHIDSGESLPEEILDKMWQARNFQSAMQMLRQLEFSLFDLRLHSEFDPDTEASIQDVLDQVREQVAVVKPPSFNRFQNSFSHIFAGGYAAGYYSYKWAEVLSADAFSLFEDRGIFHRETGLSFLNHILEQGGSEDPMVMFASFRGRKPTVDALLRHSGLSLTEEAA